MIQVEQKGALMKFFEDLLNDQSISSMGNRARARARAKGVSSFYLDPVSDNMIVEEKSDGTLVRRPVEDASPQQSDRQKVRSSG